MAKAAELSNKNLYVLQIGASYFYKLEQIYFITNWGKRYKLVKLHYYKLRQVLLQIGVAIRN